MKTLAFVLSFTAVLPSLAQNVKPTTDEVTFALSVSPSTVRTGQPARATLRVRNPRTNQQIQLQASATYVDWAGVEQTVYSNVVTLTIDYSLPVRISIPPDRVRLVPGTATFDGQPIEPAYAGGIDFDIVLPGDGRDHLLELEVTK